MGVLSRRGLFTAVLVILLVCFSFGAYAKPSLVVYSCDPAGSDSMQKIMDSFAAKNDCEVKFQAYPSDSYMQVLTAAINAGSQVDVILANGQDIRFMAEKGIIMDLTNEVKYFDRLFPAMLVPLTFSKKVYGLPLGYSSTSGVYYSKELFAKAGITTLPTTYDEFVQASAKIKKLGISPIAMGGGDIYMWPMWFFQTFAQTSKNRSFERTVDTLLGKAKFTDPDYVAAMAALARIAKDGLLIPGVNGTSMDSARAMFVSGKAAMFYGGTWEIGGWYKSEMTANDVGIMSFPVVTKGSVTQATGGPGQTVAVFAKVDPSRKALALSLTDYVTSDAMNQQYIVAMGQTTTVNKNVKVSDMDSLQSEIVTTFLPKTTTFLDWIWPPDVTKAFQQQLQSIMGGQTTPEKAMAAIQAVFADLVKKGYKFFN
jgi:raffinose/stachyose/melibiose transport system substrate-binding protein